MERFFLDWLPAAGWIIAGIIGFTGISMGAYDSLKKIYGTSYSILFGYTREGKYLVRLTGVLNRGLLLGGLFGVIGGLFWTVLAYFDRAGDTSVWYGILPGAVAGVLYGLATRNRPAIVKRAGWIGFLSGILGGGLSGGFLGATTGGGVLIISGAIAGAITGGVAGGIAGRMVSAMTGWFPGGVVGGISGGLAGQFVFAAFIGHDIFWVGPGSSVEAAIWGGILGGFGGFLIGEGVGIGVSIIGVLLTVPVLLIETGVNKLVSWLLVPSLILSRFNLIICAQCLRYTEPLRSHYKDGIRHCEHCRHEVPRTDDVGKVVVSFGNIVPPSSEGRVFPLSNPDFEQKTEPIDLSELFIDTATVDKRLLERFITYIMNHPPKNGLASVQVWCRGHLDELGDNLRNVLRNNFEQIDEEHVPTDETAAKNAK